VPTSLQCLVALALLCGCNVAFAGNFFGPGCPPERGLLERVAGVYQHRDADRYERLEIKLNGLVELHAMHDNWIDLVGGMAWQPVDMRRDEFIFDGISTSGGPVSRRFKLEYSVERSCSEVIDITDPAKPINFGASLPWWSLWWPWTEASMVTAVTTPGARNGQMVVSIVIFYLLPLLILGWVLRKYSAKGRSRAPAGN
jgi:hypothetical protein